MSVSVFMCKCASCSECGGYVLLVGLRVVSRQLWSYQSIHHVVSRRWCAQKIAAYSESAWYWHQMLQFGAVSWLWIKAVAALRTTDQRRCAAFATHGVTFVWCVIFANVCSVYSLRHIGSVLNRFFFFFFKSSNHTPNPHHYKIKNSSSVQWRRGCSFPAAAQWRYPFIRAGGMLCHILVVRFLRYSLPYLMVWFGAFSDWWKNHRFYVFLSLALFHHRKCSALQTLCRLLLLSNRKHCFFWKFDAR